MKVEVAVLGSTSKLIVLMVSVDVKQHSVNLRRTTDLMCCVKVEVAVLGSLSLTVLMVCGRKATLNLY